ncbi:hypothetical protein LguiA_031858 [Lonicera macranthoides]
MLEFQLNSGSSSGSKALNSSQSSMSSDIYPSFSRLSFNAIELPSLRSNLPENLILKPHRSSDSTFWQKTGLSFRDFSLIHHIGSDNIEKVYLCRLRPDKSYFYAMKIVDKQVFVDLKSH